jgi:hypothetical protein
MAWKNLKQRSLADSILIEHDALKELDAAHELINWFPIEQLLSGYTKNQKGKNPGHRS